MISSNFCPFHLINNSADLLPTTVHGERRGTAVGPGLVGGGDSGGGADHLLLQEDDGDLHGGHAGDRRDSLARLGLLRPRLLQVDHPCHRRRKSLYGCRPEIWFRQVSEQSI